MEACLILDSKLTRSRSTVWNSLRHKDTHRDIAALYSDCVDVPQFLFHLLRENGDELSAYQDLHIELFGRGF